MFRFFLSLTVFLIFWSQLPVSAQRTQKEIRKEIRSKAIREARKESKKLQKQGFKVTPGSLGMDKMLEETWYRLLETDEEGQAANLVADGNGVGETRTAAEMQAVEMAKLNLAGQLSTTVTALVKGNIGNSQLNNEEAASVTRVLTASKNLIAAKLARIDPVFKIYRDLKNKNVEVNVKIFYNKRKAIETARESVRDLMEKELKELHGKLDNLLNF